MPRKPTLNKAAKRDKRERPRNKGREFVGLGLHVTQAWLRKLKRISQKDNRKMIPQVRWLVDTYAAGELVYVGQDQAEKPVRIAGVGQVKRR